MELELSQRTIDAIAQRAALIVVRKMREETRRKFPTMVTTAEAAEILRITPRRMRAIAARYPHVKRGEGRQGKLLFVRDALLEH